MLNRLKRFNLLDITFAKHPKMKFSPSGATTGMGGRDMVSVLLPRIAWDPGLKGGGVRLLIRLGLVHKPGAVRIRYLML